jgi:hypothetical protein
MEKRKIPGWLKNFYIWLFKVLYKKINFFLASGEIAEITFFERDCGKVLIMLSEEALLENWEPKNIGFHSFDKKPGCFLSFAMEPLEIYSGQTAVSADETKYFNPPSSEEIELANPLEKHLKESLLVENYTHKDDTFEV